MRGIFPTLIVAFALLLTAHVTIAVGLVRGPRPRRALVVFLVPPLAPWWGWNARMRVRAAVWVAAAAVYGVALVLSTNG
jgi:hypothetical protein